MMKKMLHKNQPPGIILQKATKCNNSLDTNFSYKAILIHFAFLFIIKALIATMKSYIMLLQFNPKLVAEIIVESLDSKLLKAMKSSYLLEPFLMENPHHAKN